MIDLPDDFRDMLVCLHEAGADFVVIGGYAVAYHGHPRATKDLDVLVRPTQQNAKRVYRALAAYGAPLDEFEVGVMDFARYRGILQIGVPPLRVDVLTSIGGVSFDEAVEGEHVMRVDGHPVRVIGLPALLRSKRAAGRPQDLADVAALEGGERVP